MQFFFSVANLETTVKKDFFQLDKIKITKEKNIFSFYFNSILRLDVYTAYLDQALEWRTFIKPFQAEIWICVAASVAILTAVALILERLLPLSEAQIFDLTLLPLMAFCNQGSYFLFYFFFFSSSSVKILYLLFRNPGDSKKLQSQAFVHFIICRTYDISSGVFRGFDVLSYGTRSSDAVFGSRRPRSCETLQTGKRASF